jgi:hypothetical protein
MAAMRLLDRRSVLLMGAVFAATSPACGAPARKLAIKVYKDASCGCCTAWAERLTEAGFEVTIDDAQDMAAIKTKFGVPDDLASCHTGVIDGYTIEGHVPPADIKRLVKTRSKGKGLAVPGMPVNSPGTSMPGMADEKYTVWLFQKDGTRAAYARHGG